MRSVFFADRRQPADLDKREAEVGKLRRAGPGRSDPFVSWDRGRKLLRVYACAIGLLLLVVGLAGFTIMPKMNAAESFFHAAAGA